MEIKTKFTTKNNLQIQSNFTEILHEHILTNTDLRIVSWEKDLKERDCSLFSRIILGT